jgi:hypothetical protein
MKGRKNLFAICVLGASLGACATKPADIAPLTAASADGAVLLDGKGFEDRLSLGVPMDQSFFGFTRNDPKTGGTTSGTATWIEAVSLAEPAHVAFIGHLEPGTYTLVALSTNRGHLKTLTCLGYGTIQFAINPGEVSYLGNFQFLSSGQLNKTANDMTLAQDDLKFFPQLTAPLRPIETRHVAFAQKDGPTNIFGSPVCPR